METNILAGGSRSCFYPLTRVVSKLFRKVYNNSIVYYPFTVLVAAAANSELQEVSAYIEVIERRQDVKIVCSENAALVRGFISMTEFETLLEEMPNCEHRDYLLVVANDARQGHL